jgi:hypothetical protein
MDLIFIAYIYLLQLLLEVTIISNTASNRTRSSKTNFQKDYRPTTDLLSQFYIRSIEMPLSKSAVLIIFSNQPTNFME